MRAILVLVVAMVGNNENMPKYDPNMKYTILNTVSRKTAEPILLGILSQSNAGSALA